MADQLLHGFFYTSKERDGESHSVALPFSEKTTELITWLMSQNRLEDVSGRAYRTMYSPLVATSFPQGYFTWRGACCLFIYAQPLSDDGQLKASENSGLHLIEFSPGTVRHAWFDEEEIGAQTSREATSELVQECAEWEEQDGVRDDEFTLDDQYERLIRKNIVWLNELIARQQATDTQKVPKQQLEAEGEAEKETADKDEEGSDEAEEAEEVGPFTAWPAEKQLELVAVMLKTPGAAEAEYPVPIGEAVPIAMDAPETSVQTKCLLIRRLLPMILEDATSEAMQDYFHDKLNLPVQQYAVLLRSNLLIGRFAAEVIVSRTSREEALTRISKTLKLEPAAAETLLDNSMEVISNWPYGKLTASAKIINLAEGENPGCMAWLGLFLLTGVLLLGSVITTVIRT